MRYIVRALYRLLSAGRHRYISTYCQHDRCGDCRYTCNTCGSPCLCRCHEGGS